MRSSPLHRLFYFTFMGMELSYLYLLASLLGGPLYTHFLMLLLYPLALLCRFVLPQSAFPQRLRVTAEVVLVTVVILLVAGERLTASVVAGQADALGIILRMGFCGLSWGLGHTVPREEVRYSSIALRFQTGIIVVLVFSQLAGSVPPVVFFFLLAPLALFLARWIGSFYRGARALRSPNVGHLLLAGGSVVVPGMALILFLSPGVARSIVDWLGNIGARLSDWLDAQHKAADSTPTGSGFHLGCSVRPQSELMPPEGEFVPLPTAFPPSEGATGISPVVIWVVAFVVFAAIVVVVAFALKRQRAGRKASPVERIQFRSRVAFSDLLRSLLSFLAQLPDKLWLWLRSVLRRCRKRPRASDEALVSIRALYRSLLRWAARQGLARAAAQTPLEHLKLLEEAFPQQRDVLRLVTEAYLVARYGRRVVSHEEFCRAREAWQGVAAYHTRSQSRA